MAAEVLLPLVGALLPMAMLSGIMSTVVTGASVSHDLSGKFFRPSASQRELISVNRVSIVVALVPLYFALQKLGDVQSIMVTQTTFIACFFFVPVVVGLNWRRGTAAGAFASMAGGFLACLVWELTGQRGFARHGVDAVEVGVVTSLVLFVVVSKMTRPVPEENLKVFL